MVKKFKKLSHAMSMLDTSVVLDNAAHDITVGF